MPKEKKGAKSSSKEYALSKTASLCPECLKTLPADIFGRDGKVWIRKHCPKHGTVEDLYWGDAALYKKASKFAHDGRGVSNPNIAKTAVSCPQDCGLCRLHKSHTALANIAVTTRCDLRCWYCFFYSEKLGYVYEPSLEQIRDMIRNIRNEKPVPCNAIQLSLDANECIFVRGRDGIVIPQRIGNFVDGFMNNKNPTLLHSPIEHEKLDVDGWDIMSISDDKKVGFRPIKSVIRHKNSGDLYKLETDFGWNITTTGSHSVFVLDGNGINPKPVKSIKKGDILIGSTKFPVNNDVRTLDVLSMIESRMPNALEKIVVCGYSKEELKMFESLEKRRIAWDSVSYDTYVKSGRKGGTMIRYFNSKKGKELPINVPVTPELCRLLGYYAGEGCCYKSGITFTFSSKETDLVSDLEHCIRSVFGSTNIRKRPCLDSAIQIFVEGYLYKIFFNAMGAGGRATEKSVPWLVFNVNEELQKEFLKAYFRCDGCTKIRASGLEIDHNTVSARLASDIVWLHLKFGITSKVETSISKPHIVNKTGQFISKASKKFRVVIDSKNDIEKSLWYLDGRVRERFKEYASKEERHSSSHMRLPINSSILSMSGTNVDNKRINYLQRRIRHDDSISKDNLAEITDYFREHGLDFDCQLNDISHSDVGFFAIRKINKIESTSEYVYDVSVPSTEAFFSGMGPLLAHNTGGEPTLRKDIIDIIRMCKKEGIDHVQLNTNGIRVSREPGFARAVREAGVNTLYLSFDGVSPKTNPKNHWEIPGVLQRCRETGTGVVLVPTMIKGINDHEIGDIVRFGFENNDVVRGVNIQPVSLVGRISHAERMKMRITISDVIEKLEQQTDNQIGKEDFYPVPTLTNFTRFVEALVHKPQYDLSSHFACGMATYVFRGEGGKMLPITRFVDVDGFLEYLGERAEELEKGKNKYLVGLKMLRQLGRYIDKGKAPKDFKLAKIIYNALMKHDYSALGAFHHKSLFIGTMAFMDLYNYDIERVKRCTIHYAMTDGRIIPFCAFNVIPQWYRDVNQRSQGIDIKRWEQETGKKIEADAYKRNIPLLENTELYKKTYGNFS